MTTLREAAQQALEALELVTDLTNHDDEIYDAIDALRAALAEPVQKPVSFIEAAVDNDCAYAYADGWNNCVRAHKGIAPPHRPAELVQEPFALPCPTPKACKAHCCSGNCIPRSKA